MIHIADDDLIEWQGWWAKKSDIEHMLLKPGGIIRVWKRVTKWNRLHRRLARAWKAAKVELTQ